MIFGNKITFCKKKYLLAFNLLANNTYNSLNALSNLFIPSEAVVLK